MRLEKIFLRNFRNYEEEAFSFSPETNVIFGRNAQGKTNLLEAIYYLTSARSFRGTRDRDLIRRGCGEGAVSASVQTGDRLITLEAGISMSARKRLFVNGVKMRSAAEFAGNLCAVLFSPEDLGLVKDGSAARRRFMDLCFSQLRPRYAKALSVYNRLHEHKLRILKNREARPDLLDALDVFSRQMAGTGALLVGYRALFLEKMAARASALHREISGGEMLEIRYRTVSTVEDLRAPVSQLEEALLRHAQEHRAAELASGSVLSGPHRDDIEIIIDGLPARTHASQGQTRTAALSLKLAERELLHSEREEAPVLLLDDVLSELDERRRDYVLNHFTGQVFITLCDRGDMKNFSGRAFRVENGKLKN